SSLRSSQRLSLGLFGQPLQVDDSTRRGEFVPQKHFLLKEEKTFAIAIMTEKETLGGKDAGFSHDVQIRISG
ncbi:MAG: hypothetical protein HY707_08540, partial [Ignavibacteriae bacterium]|nr:hypothetical protein [Ignavibacteriota bacterium]